MPDGSAVVDQLFNILWCKSNEDYPKEGPLNLPGRCPIFRHEVEEVPDTDCELPHLVNGELVPHWDPQLLSCCTLEVPFIPIEYILKELKRTVLHAWET